MPIYEYACEDCTAKFEVLVRRNEEPKACTACGSAHIARQLSLPRVKSESTHALAMAAAKRRDQADAKDKAHEQRKYELSHDD